MAERLETIERERLPTHPVIQTIGAAVIILDLRGKITHFNRAAEILSGYRSEEALGKRVWDFLVASDDAPTLREGFEDLIALGLQTQMETTWITREGHKRIVEWSNALALDEKGNPKWIVETSVDVTDQRETERQLKIAKASLEKAVQARDDFMSIAAHELRTPMTSLRLQIQLLKNTPSVRAVSPLVSKLLDGADQQLARMSGLILDMLDTVNISLGRLQLKCDEADLSELVRNVIAQLNGLISDAGMRVEVIAPEPVRGRWDRYRIEQVILNLMTNAIKFGKSRPITVRVRQENNHVLLEVEDRGQGISKEEQKRVFGRFARGRGECKSGLGLGLYISKRIALAHRGDLRVESKLGSGSTFILDIPQRVESCGEEAVNYAA